MSTSELGTAYVSRRDWIGRYFDDRADRWEVLTSAEPVGRIRTTVREGRRAMQDAILAWLPSDLTGVRVLDAGCGPGSFALRIAERGASVTGVDVSEALVDVARARAASYAGPGEIHLEVGDMLAVDAHRGAPFDYVIALDSLINYPLAELRGAVARVAASTRRGVIFTVAPKTPLLAVMHGIGKIFPRANRAPAIEPVPTGALARWVDGASELEGWRVADRAAVSRGFYMSTAFHLSRTEARGMGGKEAAA
jgi:magnesium-protoporphyrin O-methyltransferase